VSTSLAESADVARACADAYRQLVAYYRDETGASAAEADALARQPKGYALTAPSHEIGWMALNGLLESDPAAALAVWERVRSDAERYIEGAAHIADALQHTTPWQRAQFVALRSALHQDWKPSGATEALLVDTYAASFVSYLHWLGRAHERDALPARQPSPEWTVPTQSQAEAIDQAAVLADRFHRQMVRALRAMRDLRRYGSVIITGPAQVNIAQQQVNAARVEQA
jgi:hypothetical protein